MTITISSGFFTPYFDAVNYLLEEPMIGRSAVVYYEQNSTRDYNIFTEDRMDTKEVVSSENIQLRLYSTPKNWIKTSQVVEFIKGRVQILGYMIDANKLRRCSYVEVDGTRYKLATDPVRHGFGDRYFLAFLDLI